MDHAPQPESEDDAERRRIVTVLGEVGFCLPGSVSDERSRCGKTSCRCKADPPLLHGPYHHWTRKIDGRTVGRYLTDDQLERYAGWSLTTAASFGRYPSADLRKEGFTDTGPSKTASTGSEM